LPTSRNGRPCRRAHEEELSQQLGDAADRVDREHAAEREHGAGEQIDGSHLRERRAQCGPLQ
jgi:hypothetical protein